MGDLGRILIADDEETFLHSTADLLREQGYECTCTPDAFSAADLLKKQDFDLLIADIRMPGNEELELIQRLPQIREHLPVILITAYPSLASAIESVHLAVAAYLVKPFEFEQLLSKVRVSVEHSRVNRVVRAMRNRLQDWQQDLDNIEKSLGDAPGHQASTPSVSTFSELTFRNIAGALQDLDHIMKSVGQAHEPPQDVCHLLNCPKLDTLTGALMDAIQVIEKTKVAFKSKELAALRKRLEQVMGNEAP
jgi:DNA-binding response OmpR family regulator